MELARTLLILNPDTEIVDNHKGKAFDIARTYGRIPLAHRDDDDNRPTAMGSGPNQTTIPDAKSLAQRLTPDGPTS